MNLMKHKGFTLIELVIVIAVVGILSAIAYPSYQEYVRAGKRSDATGALEGLAGAMERFFTTNGTYADVIALNLYPSQSPVDGGTPAYNLTVPAGGLTATTYTLNATPVGVQAGDRCGTLTLTNTGTKGQTGVGVTVADCWK